MPMIDVTIPEGALTPQAEEQLMKELSEILIKAEGFNVANDVARNVTWLFLHRPSAIYVAGTRSRTPRYRIVPTVPEGQYTDAAREALVRNVTEAVVRADGGKFEDVAPHVWVFPTEISDGHWGSRGAIRRLPEIQTMLGVGEADGKDHHKIGQDRLARRRRSQALVLLEGALDAVRAATAADQSAD